MDLHLFYRKVLLPFFDKFEAKHFNKYTKTETDSRNKLGNI